MLTSLFRFYVITCNSLIAYKKILNIPKRTHDTFLFAIISLPITFALEFIHDFIPQLDYIFMLVCAYVVLQIFYKANPLTTFFTVTISIGLNLCAFVLEANITILLMLPYAILSDYNYDTTFSIVSDISILITHFVFLFLFFKMKAFKNGFPYINSPSNNYVVFFVCLCAINLFAFLGNKSFSFPILLMFVLLIIFINIFIWLWWQDQNKRIFVTSLISRQMLALVNETTDLKEYISKLEADNEKMGNIIHRDNKIIPAMVTAMEQLAASYPENMEFADNLKKLQSISGQRLGLLNTDKRSDTLISKSGSIRIDSIINYMYKKAKMNNITLDYTANVNICSLDISTEDDICTLIADAVENAIIATSHAGNHNIMLQLDIQKDVLCIAVYDNGIPFPAKAIQNMGRFRYTSHLKEGGSGIGMMTTFEILKKYNASYHIDETIDNPSFTKCIYINFDNRHIIMHNNKRIR